MKLTFIGLGKMGAAMVERLLKAEYDVTVFNRTLSKQEPLVAQGAHSSQSIAESVSNADVVMTCLLNDKAVLTVTHEMMPELKSGAIHVGLSTIMPDTAKALQGAHKEHGSKYVSAVVLGVPKVAQQGKLTSFCAGEESDLSTATDIIKAFADNVVPLGTDIHAPNVMKICMNYSLMTTIELISELYTFAEKSGLDTSIVQMGLHQIYAHPAFKLYIDKIHDRNFDEVNFDMVGGNKDVSLFQVSFSRAGVPPVLANAVKTRFISALSNDMQDKDWSSIYEIIRAESGLS